MPSPLLTIVTINFNNASNLSRTLTSLEEVRADSEMECLFIDGASTDGSLTIASRFYAPEMIVSEPDRGIYDAMNKGLARAQGQYVLWLNSGDELLPGSGLVLKNSLRVSTAAMVSFGLEIICESSVQPPYVHYPAVDDLPHTAWPHPSTCFHKVTLARLGGYSEKYKLASDYEAMLKIYFQRLPLLAIPQAVSRFYTGGRSSSVDIMYECLEIHKLYGLNTALYRAYLRMRLLGYRTKNIFRMLVS